MRISYKASLTSYYHDVLKIPFILFYIVEVLRKLISGPKVWNFIIS